MTNQELHDLQRALERRDYYGTVGQWCACAPRTEVLPDMIRVIGEGLSIREKPRYDSKKIGKKLFSKLQLEEGTEQRPLEHQEEIYGGYLINFYRIEFNIDGLRGRMHQGWLLDYSPGQSRRTLEIMYL